MTLDRDAVESLIAWLRRRGEPDSGMSYEARNSFSGRARAVVHGSDATFIADHFHGSGARELADALEALSHRGAWKAAPEDIAVMPADTAPRAIRTAWEIEQDRLSHREATEGGEAVAWRYRDAWGRWAYCEAVDNVTGPAVITEKQPLYTHPAPTTPVEPTEVQVEALPKLTNCGHYLAEDNAGHWHYLNHANEWQPYPGPQTPLAKAIAVEGVALIDALSAASTIPAAGVAVAGAEIEPEPQPLSIIYTNWRGETAERTILPLRMWFGSTEWHPEPQWLLTAIDTEKNAERDFAWSGIDFQGNGPEARDAALEEVDWHNLAVNLRRLFDNRPPGMGANYVHDLHTAISAVEKVALKHEAK